MIWAIAGGGLVGLLVGCRYAVPALLVASAGDIAVVGAAGAFAGWSLRSTVVTMLGSLAALQGGYATGLIIARAFPRIGRSSTRGRPDLTQR
jgi:hypothetical protein